jgi:hypothetical protein
MVFSRRFLAPPQSSATFRERDQPANMQPANMRASLLLFHLASLLLF